MTYALHFCSAVSAAITISIRACSVFPLAYIILHDFQKSFPIFMSREHALIHIFISREQELIHINILREQALVMMSVLNLISLFLSSFHLHLHFPNLIADTVCPL